MIYNLFLILISILLTSSCTQTTKSTVAKKVYIDNTIQENKIEAQKAKEAYLKLQRNRNSD